MKDDQIQQNAVKSGWPEGLVKEAIDSVRGTTKASPGTIDLPVATTPERRRPRPRRPERVAPAAAPPAGGAPPTAKFEPRTVSGAEPEPGSIVKPAVPNRGVSDEYRIGEGDVLGVSVWGEPAASVSSVVVRPDGIISMPLIKDVRWPA